MIKRSEHISSLLEDVRSELEIMNMLFIHDMIKRSEHISSLLEDVRSELEIMNVFYIHDIMKVTEAKCEEYMEKF